MAGMTRDEYMAKWHPEDAPKPQAWLLTVGEYDEYTVLGVLLGTEEQAEARADAMTIERARREFPNNVASDLIAVRFEETEVLS